MSSTDTKIRVRNAFNAMKAIGFNVENVRPVLKSLLRLYGKNWELIEEDNYRALADALFENEKAEEFEEPTQASEETPRPLKRLRSKNQLLVPKEEPCEIPESCGPPRLKASQNEGRQPSLDPSPLTDNDNDDLAITKIVVTMRRLIEQFNNQSKLLSDAKKEALEAKLIADAKDKALASAEEKARASMAALKKMEKEKFDVEEQLKNVREALEYAHKLAIRSHDD